jgi:F0F1-type ATP synthase assembly protein I
VNRFLKRYQTRAFARGYQAGLEAVVALAVAGAVGAWIDSRQGTAPVFLLVGIAVGFGACTLRLVRYQREQQRRAGMQEQEESEPRR